jgi:hypothetical protein
MTTEIGRWQTPEERELARKRAELDALESQLAQRELDLATTLADLAAFEARYLAVLGPRFAERDALEARLASALAPERPDGSTPPGRAAQPQTTAEEAALTRGQPPADQPPTPFMPSERLKRLYRAVARRVHPDLAVDAATRERRSRLMAEANEAYRAGDTVRLRAVAHTWVSDPDAVEGAGPAADLVRVIRMLAQAESRLQAIDAECARLKESDLWHLRTAADEAAAEGVDLLMQLATQLDAEIAADRQRLSALAPGVVTGSSRSESSAPQQAGAGPRALRFPEDRSLGMVSIRRPDGPDGSQWVPIGEAQGVVQVTADVDVRLVVSPDAAFDLAPLAALGPAGLRQLVLSSTLADDAQLVHLRPLTGLERLYLDGTPVQGPGLGHLQGLTGLRVLSLGRTRVGDGGVAHLRGLTALVSLNLQSTPVGDAGIGYLSALRALEVLSLAGTRVTDDGVAHLGGMTALQTLVLSGTAVGDAGLAELRHLASLRWLALAQTAITDAGLKHLWGLSRLEGLNLRDTAITDLGLAYLRSRTTLRVLDLGGTAVTDGGLFHLRPLARLQRLSLSGTAVGDAGLVHLHDLAELHELDLSGTGVTDAGVPDLQVVRGLRLLRLGGTRVTPAALRALARVLPSCQIEPPL